MDFPYNTGAYAYRPLKLKDPMQRGWDVYAVQTGLAYLTYALSTDGIFGTQTQARVKAFQKDAAITVDGIAGIATQTQIAAKVCLTINDMEPKRVYGQIEKESGFQLGNYTAPYTNGSRDRGLLQENSKYYPSPADAFNVSKAIGAFTPKIVAKHDRYANAGVNDDRAWAAAQGSWNNQVYADDYAMGDPVPDAFLAYISAVTAYV